MTRDIWILCTQRKGSFEDLTYGLVAEARRLKTLGQGTICALVPDPFPKEALRTLGASGVDRVIVVEKNSTLRVSVERYGRTLTRLAREERPAFILMAHNSLAEDLGPRLAAGLETGFISRAVDLWIDPQGRAVGVRPIANGHLFEEVRFLGEGTCLISFLPSVLSPGEKGAETEPELVFVPGDKEEDPPALQVLEVIEADPESAGLEDAEIIICGGRGVGKGPAFEIVQDLARVIGASVAGTRPVIDWQILPLERQIGQTGKTVSPGLMIACGISGANEFTAGMEKSQWVIAINTDPRARIFRFADLGVVGDVHQILTRLIERIEKEKNGSQES
jgi:electron transfer flavoprotein alpha subunit